MKFRYVKVEPKNRPDITAIFVFKLYKHKRGWYYKEYYSKREGEPIWFHGKNHFSEKFIPDSWRNGNIKWLENWEVFAFFL